jgi:hypothetical protein
VVEPRQVAEAIALPCFDAADGVNGEALTATLGGIRQPRFQASVGRLLEVHV